MSTLNKQEIIAQAHAAASRMRAQMGYGLEPYSLMGVLELNSRMIEDEKEIEQIKMLITINGTKPFEYSNNQMACTEKYVIGDYTYSFTSFNYGPDIVHETLIITEEDFQS